MLGDRDGEELRMRAGASPGTTVTSRSSVKSSSSVGGWCWRGQVDTAAVSCSSSRIHTWIRPVGGRTRRQGDAPVRGGTEAEPALTCVVVELLQDALHPVLRADGALLRPGRQAGEPSAEEHRLGRHLVDLRQQLSIKQDAGRGNGTVFQFTGALIKNVN